MNEELLIGIDCEGIRLWNISKSEWNAQERACIIGREERKIKVSVKYFNVYEENIFIVTEEGMMLMLDKNLNAKHRITREGLIVLFGGI